jgi:polysaccharide deacetylase 2 family uncharacterized protein YibQ
MARKRRASSKQRPAPQMLVALAVIALALFLGGELFAFIGSDRGRVLLYRNLHLGRRADVVRILGKRVSEGLDAARVPHDAVLEESAAGADGGTPVWKVSLPADGAPLQVNFAITQAVRRIGGEVFSTRETPGREGADEVRMLVGFPGRTLHEIRLTRPAHAASAGEAARPARIALLLVDVGDDSADRRALLSRPEPFAVGVPALGSGRSALLKAARAGGHQVVLQVPMEPENYPRINPGPGTLLVSMPASRIERELHAELSGAGEIAAVSNFMGSFASQDEPFMTAFYRELRRSSKSFLHVQPVPRAVCREVAAQVGVAYDEPDAFLDREARESGPRALERAWKSIRERAGRRGQAIVVLRVTPVSRAWLERALAPKALAGATLVPISELLHRPGAS